MTFTFASALAIGLRPLLRPTTLWLLIGALLGANIFVARTMLGTQAGWQLYWVLVGTVVLISAISVANLYVQGGMQLRHAAWFTLLLAAYDFYFSQIVPLTPELADRFQGYPLNAAVGFRFDVFNAAIGIGDLLAFGIFGAAAYKAYGAKALRLTLAFIVVVRRRRPEPDAARPRRLHPWQPQHRGTRPDLVRTAGVPALPLDARPLRPGTDNGPVPRHRRHRRCSASRSHGPLRDRDRRTTRMSRSAVARPARFRCIDDPAGRPGPGSNLRTRLRRLFIYPGGNSWSDVFS